jgi:hypothetical protein
VTRTTSLGRDSMMNRFSAIASSAYYASLDFGMSRHGCERLDTTNHDVIMITGGGREDLPVDEPAAPKR